MFEGDDADIVAEVAKELRAIRLRRVFGVTDTGDFGLWGPENNLGSNNNGVKGIKFYHKESGDI